jgi:hypothetical protein
MASASTITYNMQSPTTQTTSSSYAYGSGTTLLVANGYNSGAPSNGFNPNATIAGGQTSNSSLQTKSAGADETGLGMANDPIDPVDHEISGANFIQLNFSAPIAAFASVTASLVVTSVQSGETFQIWVSDTLGNPGTALSGSNYGVSSDGVAINLNPSGALHKYYSVSSPNGNVLLATVSITPTSGSQVTTPEPATAGLTGLVLCVGVAFVQRRRSRRSGSK